MSEGANIGLRRAAGALEGAAAGAPSSLPGAGADAQVDLFDLDGPEGASGPVTAVLQSRRGPGRPPGSPNKKTEDLRRFLLARFKHPAVALAEIYSVPTTCLAAELGMKAGDVLALQIRAAAEVAPYVDSRMPAKIAISDSDRLPGFNLVFGDGRVAIEDKSGKRVDLTELAARAKAALDQRLGAGEALGSHDAGSHDEAQVIDGVAERVE